MSSAGSLSHAPFLVWPVARREFYRALSFALLPTLVWGCVIFGWRPLAMAATAVAAVSISHGLLKRWTRRGKTLVYPHAVTSALLLAALCYPFWPAWVVGCIALMLPPVFTLLGGPGKEPVHVAALAALLLQFMLPLLPNAGVLNSSPYALLPEPAILARDRLLMGDIRNQGRAPLYHWPSSLDLQGDDAVRMTPPALVVRETLDSLDEELSRPRAATATHPATTLPVSTMRGTFDAAFAGELPGIEGLLMGAVPGRTGLVSIIGILIGGLYLAYRYMLRPRSVALYLIAYLIFLALLAFAPAVVMHGNAHAFLRFVAVFPGELLTLLAYLFFSSDAIFAAVFILALPGTEPLTPRGRRVFLVVAALGAAALTRFARPGLPLPASTVSFIVLMPAARWFDALFAKASWLNRR
ncbi:MAG TPA: RnfABCDGE type electron transport complex subunit D [Phycisphaerae bacterium]|nr:RnfABCDGE type electron transport complex subunit D [Phycisphaerae bacterium]